MDVKFIECQKFDLVQGTLLKFVQSEHSDFSGFGESYFSWVNPGFVKGWYKHNQITSYLTCPTLNLYVATITEGVIREFKICKENYGYLIIPQNCFYAMKSLDGVPALVANTLSHKYSADEVEKKDAKEFESWIFDA